MTKNKKLALYVLIGLMTCGLGSTIPVRAATTTITNADELNVTVVNKQGEAVYTYDIYTPKPEAGKDVTIDLTSFSPAGSHEKEVFGYYTNDSAAEPITGMNLTFISLGGTHQVSTIAGAYSESGDVGSYTGPAGEDEVAGTTDSPSNTVTITGNIPSTVMAGYSYSGTVTNTKLILKDQADVSNLAVYGGYSQKGNATHNTTYIDLPAETSSLGLIFGGITGTKDASYNKIEIKSLGDGSNVIGGETFYGNASHNQVIIDDATVATTIGGNVTGPGGAADWNTVTINKGTVKDTGVLGGYAPNGTTSASHNTVTIGDVQVSGVFLGGVTNGTDASYNTINFTAGADTPHTYEPYFLYVGNSNGTANSNQLHVGKGTTIVSTLYSIAGAGNTEANENTIDVSGSLSAGNYIVAGWANTNANGNIINVSGSISAGALIVAGLADAKADENKITISGSLPDGQTVYAGTGGGEANENQLTISGSIGSGSMLFAGEGSTTANGNIVTIDQGAVFSESASSDTRVVAGNGTTDASNNIVNLNGTVQSSSLDLYGGLMGLSYDSNSWNYGGESGTGNILNVKSLNNQVKEIAGFQNLNFYIPKEAVNGSTMLTITGGTETDLTGATIKADASNATTLNVGDKINLLVNNAGVITDGTTQYGVLTDAGFAQTGVEVKKEDEKTVIATITRLPVKLPNTSDNSSDNPSEDTPNTPSKGLTNPRGSLPDTSENKPSDTSSDKPASEPEKAATLHPDTKSLVEGKVDGLAGLKHNLQFVATDGIQSAMAAAQANAVVNSSDSSKGSGGDNGSNGASAMKLNMDAIARFTPYAVMGGESLRYETGSYVRSQGFNVNVGLVRRLQRESYIDTIMPFIEYGKGNYSTFLDSGARGDGEHQYLGGGILVRRDRNDGLYYEGSLHGGHIKGDYTGIIYGTRSAYNSSSPYIAMHAGIGKILPLQKNTSLDAYAKLFWTHEGSDTVTLRSSNGQSQYHFDSMDSIATRLGVRWNRTVRKH